MADQPQRQFSDGRWWQWDGTTWAMEPAMPPPAVTTPALSQPATAPTVPVGAPRHAAEEPWNGDTSDPEYQRVYDETLAERRSSSKVVAWTAVAVVLVAAIGTGIYFLTKPKGDTALRLAAIKCELIGKPGALLEDSDRTLTLDGQGKEDLTGLPIFSTGCVLGALKAPGSVTAQMEGTRALDGRQTANWDNINASWTYHPDQGLDLILTES